MSMHINARPVKNDWVNVASSNALYLILDKEYGIPCRLNDSCIPFLRGLVACGYKDVQEIIEMLENHSEIELSTQS